MFPGGGATGAAQVGMLKALLEAGIVPDLLVGVSVGALNAAFIAVDPVPERVDKLAAIWRGLSRPDVFGRNPYYTVSRLLLRHDHITTPAPLRALISRFCPMERLEDADVPIQIVTTDLDNGVERWWGRGPAADILYASACLPGLFPPAVLGGHRHVDGGVLEPVPVRRALDLDVTTAYVLGVPSGSERRQPKRPSALEVLIRSFDICRYARLPEPEMLARSGQRVIPVPGADKSMIAITDFSETDRLIDESYEVSRAFLAGVRPTGDPPMGPGAVVRPGGNRRAG